MMDVKAEKLWLIDQIVKIQDLDLLQTIKHLLEQDNSVVADTKTDFWQDLSPMQQQQVERSIQQLD